MVFTIVSSLGVADDEVGDFHIPKQWKYSHPLISPEKRAEEPSKAQKDPTVVFYEGRWHVFMTVKLPERSAIEYCSFEKWEDGDSSERTLLDICDSDYFCAPQVFFYTPHEKWYLIYQAGMPEAKKMWVAYSTTENISDPNSWTKAAPILDGGEEDPRKVGGLDFWIICDETKAYLFFTSLNGKMWRLSTTKEKFPSGFSDFKLAMSGNFFEASHTYRIKGSEKFVTLVEAKGQRYFQAYLADRLDGNWKPLANSFPKPFASAKNCIPGDGVEIWTDNFSHGELIRDGVDENLVIDPENLQFLFQGMMEEDKKGGYGKYQWKLGLLTPAN